MYVQIIIKLEKSNIYLIFNQQMNTNPKSLNLSKSGCLTLNLTDVSENKCQQLKETYLNMQLPTGTKVLNQVFIDDLQYVTQCESTYQLIQFYESSKFKYSKKERFDELDEIAIMDPHSLQKMPKIVHIDFPNLKRLVVKGICVNSIEGLGFMKMPVLQKLQLQQNRITSIKPLVKAHLPRLNLLFLHNNRFHQIQPINRCVFLDLDELGLNNSIVGEFMWTQLQQNDHDIIVQNLKPLFKFQQIMKRILRTNHKTRILKIWVMDLMRY